MSAKQLAAQVILECKHFRGVQHDTCAAGVSLATVRDNDPAPGCARFPCLTFPSQRQAATTCAKREMYTQEEADAEGERLEARVAEALTALADGLCPACRAKVETRKRVGRCEYAEPCGHRLGQVGDAGDEP